MSDRTYQLLLTCQAAFATSFGMMMCVQPLFFEFISSQPYGLHTQDSIRVCGPFVVLLGMMAYRTRSLAEDARRAFSQTCLICYSMAVLLCLGGYNSGRWNWYVCVCACICVCLHSFCFFTTSSCFYQSGR